MTRPSRLRSILLAAFAQGALLVAPASEPLAGDPVETPMLADAVAAGELPPVAERLPAAPWIVAFDGEETEAGKPGGDMNIVMARSKDVRMMVVYGYARLVCYNEELELVADILRDVEVADGRVFTLHLRPGHKWSDGHPFTAEDFRFWWEDVANNEELSPVGPPQTMLVDGEKPNFEVVDEATVRFSWSKPNPFFLPALAGARPLYIYRPAHYLKSLHIDYADKEKLLAEVAERGQSSWAALFNKKGNQYKNQNIKLPTLQPWVNTTKGPSDRYVFVRNPYYHRVDEAGHQLPYLDRVVMNVTDGGLIATKTGAGESDLQARYLSFNNYTYLKSGEERNDFNVRLWRTARGSHIALFPNLNAKDPVWRAVLRDVRFRRALSLAIDREEINQVIYFGLALNSANTVLPKSPLFSEALQTAWTAFDLEQANALLDEMGLTERGDQDVRLLPNGEPLRIIIETAGEDTEQTDVLELIHDSWLKAGIKLFTKPSQREVFRNRIFSGETTMAVWWGLENGLATPAMSPHELAPTSQQQYQWPKWGQYHETGGQSGEPLDMPEAKELMRLNDQWRLAADPETRREIWQRMLQIHADNVYSIGIVAGVLQPVVVNEALKNVPLEGVYNWDPGAHFGIYKPDTFWLTEDGQQS